MSEVKYVEFLNFLNFGGEDEKQLVGLRQASGRRQKQEVITYPNNVPSTLIQILNH